MSGWCPSFSVCGMAVVCAAAVLPGAVVWLVPYSSQCSTHQYCCHVVYCSLPGAAVCGWWTCVCGVRVVGYPLSTPPSSWWRVGPSWTVGCRCGGGWHGEGRAVVLLGSRLCVGVPLVVYPVALLNGGAGYVLCCPCSDWVLSFTLLLPFSYCLVPLVLFPFLFCLVLLCLLWVGKCGGVRSIAVVLLLPCCAVQHCRVVLCEWLYSSFPSSFRLCVCCHGIVGLGLCLCGRVV